MSNSPSKTPPKKLPLWRRNTELGLIIGGFLLAVYGLFFSGLGWLHTRPTVVAERPVLPEQVVVGENVVTIVLRNDGWWPRRVVGLTSC